MAKRRSRDSAPSGDDVGAPRNNPFGVLQSLRGSLPAGTDGCPGKDAVEPPFAGRIVIARERAGRGGKTVTVVRGVLSDAETLAEIARRMRQSLGTGGSVEGETIVLGGDQVRRAADWLRAEGATRIVIGT